MYLSKLEIFGFKSFARKTTFDFHNGITGVVGPNGCGKSNIVDSIRWVLGEQRVSTLRSEMMENVIFNGSKTAKPLGMSEVSLTIENTRNVLPIEFTEVVITRRLFRSGESQYLLNNSPCRLKDIMDLFMDTGIGANAYSVIELPMIEHILNGNPEERRRILEEAAGVVKYKARRRAAFRKLEATEQDLLRLNDILSEVEKNVDSLKRQVQRAHRYQVLIDELKETEVKLSACQLRNIRDELEPLAAQSKNVGDRRQELSATIATAEAQIEEARLQILDIEKQLVAHQRDLNVNTQRLQQKEEEVLVSQERIRAVDENRVRFVQEILELKTRSGQVQVSGVQVEEKLAGIRRELEDLQKVMEEKQPHLSTLEQAYVMVRRQVREADTARMTELEKFGEANKEQERLKAQIEQGEARRTELATTRVALQAREVDLAQRRANITRQIAGVLAGLDRRRGHLTDNQQAIASAQSRLQQLKELMLDNAGQTQQRRDRIGLLRKFLETYEDHPEGVKYLVLEKTLSTGCLGTLGDQLRVPKHYRRAIEAALGEALVALLVEDPDRAFAGMEVLRQKEKGVVTFIAMSLAGKRYGAPAMSFSDQRVIASAAAVVECGSRLRGLVDNLLQDFYIVGTLQHARELLASAAGKRHSYVTLEGEVVSTWGPIRGGQIVDQSRQVAGLIGRREHLQQLEEEVARLLEAHARLETQRDAEATNVKTLQQNNDELQDAVRQLEADRQRLELELGQCSFELQKCQEEAAHCDGEEQKLIAAGQASNAALNLCQQRLAAFTGRRQQAESHHASVAEAVETAEREWHAAKQAANDAQMRVVEKRAEERNLLLEIERNQSSLEEIAAAIQRRTEQIADAERQSEELTETVARLREQMQDDFAQRKQLEQVIAELEKTFGERKQATDSQERALRSVHSEREELSDRLRRHEVRLTELSMRRENIINHIRENYEMEITQQPAPEEFDIAAATERVEWLRNRLKTLGPVNMLALKEYETEKQRLDFLTTQKNDLLKAEENLKETIRVINATAYERFGTIFSQVRENFIQVFRSFFENGEADLKLAEGDPLEAEVIIEANPKGRRLGSLALLSGGEKTLTAISLLFAIYLVKPSPFCILDEVDAPLDDMNIGRFVSALKKFSDNTQFIVVTHNKLTMKAADYLYGITMEEPGVSKVVSVKFEDIDVGKPPRPAAAEVVA